MKTKRLQIALIDAAKNVIHPTDRTESLETYSNRVSSITAKNFSYLNNLVKDNSRILETHSHAFSSMCVWDGDSPESVLNFSDSEMGRIIENNSIIWALTSHANDGVDIYSGENVNVKAVLTDSVILELSNQDISCSLLVGADGKNSIVRKIIKPNIIGRSYQQKGLVATVRVAAAHHHRPQANHNSIAYQRFLPTGPIALLPLGNDVMSIVWTLPTEIVDKLLMMKLTPETWRLLLQTALRLMTADSNYLMLHPESMTMEEYCWRNSALEAEQKDFIGSLPEIVQVNPKSLAAFPLDMAIAQSTVANRAIIIGDAAHVIHPLAGQGVNLGIADVKDLEMVIAEAASIGSDLGDATLYKNYEIRRRVITAAMSGFVDGIHQLFDPSFPLPKIRRIGMGLFEKFETLKSLTVRLAQL